MPPAARFARPRDSQAATASEVTGSKQTCSTCHVAGSDLTQTRRVVRRTVTPEPSKMAAVSWAALAGPRFRRRAPGAASLGGSWERFLGAAFFGAALATARLEGLLAKVLFGAGPSLGAASSRSLLSQQFFSGGLFFAQPSCADDLGAAFLGAAYHRLTGGSWPLGSFCLCFRLPSISRTRIPPRQNFGAAEMSRWGTALFTEAYLGPHESERVLRPALSKRSRLPHFFRVDRMREIFLREGPRARPLGAEARSDTGILPPSVGSPEVFR